MTSEERVVIDAVLRLCDLNDALDGPLTSKERAHLRSILGAGFALRESRNRQSSGQDLNYGPPIGQVMEDPKATVYELWERNYDMDGCPTTMVMTQRWVVRGQQRDIVWAPWLPGYPPRDFV